MTALLVLTTGRSDVQLVQDGMRRELAKGKTASLHDEIQRRAGEWCLVDTPTSKGTEAASLPEGAFDLCTPKLDAVLQYVEEKRIKLTCALILETRRDPQVEAGDPRYAGAILAQRMRERGISHLCRCAYLRQDDKDYADKANQRDAIIRRDVVARINDAVRICLKGEDPERIVLATTGGIPVCNALVNEIVRLHAPSTVEIDPLEVEDRSRKNPPEADVAISCSSVPEPRESFRARKRALDLIEKGNLLGAWGAVQHLDADEVEHRWTKVVEWLARFAAARPIPEECDIDVLKHERMSVRTALRVELALHARDIPRAVHGTVAFFESALWDHLNKFVNPHADNKDNKRLYKVVPDPDSSIIRKNSEDRNRPFEVVLVNGNRWYKIFEDGACGVRIAKHYLKKGSLCDLGKAVNRIRNLRNDVAHNEPTPQLMEEARAKVIKESLWSQDDTFLNQPLIGNVLRKLGEQHPVNLCNQLIETVRSRLLHTITS